MDPILIELLLEMKICQNCGNSRIAHYSMVFYFQFSILINTKLRLMRGLARWRLKETGEFMNIVTF